MGYLQFDCPGMDRNHNDFISIEELETILKNPCYECYPDPYTASSPYIINGKTCALTGTTS